MRNSVKMFLKGLGIVSIICVSFALGKSNTADERKVYIPSDEMRKSIVESAKWNPETEQEEVITDELPTVRQVERVDNVFLTGRSLEGAQYLTNVESAVYIPAEEGSIDMRPIGKMKNLKMLQYYTYPTEDKGTHMVQDISYLSELQKLESLDLYHYPVLDLTPLSNLKNLNRFNGASNVTAPKMIVDKKFKQILFEHPMKYSTQFSDGSKDVNYASMSNEDGSWNKEIKPDLKGNIITISNIEEQATNIEIHLGASSADKYYRHELIYEIPIVWY
ncbi:hypothetical protein [Candidatus Enterococcus ikei]|uniref:WxL domain-containing protein n=1 Tax=Candidatus Enterococcus ikei TaxID=2815326 RepID=A0ABS3GZ96_9ENTE|nr:hypothetical protein [Enterococcus sp. DIV0869a]MBO0440582.1 hypothetical protein [Enterococcus sp. DIV0869a]